MQPHTLAEVNAHGAGGGCFVSVIIEEAVLHNKNRVGSGHAQRPLGALAARFAASSMGVLGSSLAYFRVKYVLGCLLAATDILLL